MSGSEATHEIWRPTTESAGAAAPPPTFSVVVPTAGRETLGRTLASISHQIRPGDEIIVECTNDGDWGNAARQRGIEAATSSHILFCDDDDVFLQGALAVMRQFAAEHPKALGIFRRRFNTGPPQWRDPVLRPGNVQCMGFVIPNVRGRLGVWGPQSSNPEKQAALDAAGVRRWSDAYFVSETAEKQNAPVIFCDVIVGHARPERNPLRKLRYRLELGAKLRKQLSTGVRPAPAGSSEPPPSRPT